MFDAVGWNATQMDVHRILAPVGCVYPQISLSLEISLLRHFIWDLVRLFGWDVLQEALGSIPIWESQVHLVFSSHVLLTYLQDPNLSQRSKHSAIRTSSQTKSHLLYYPRCQIGTCRRRLIHFKYRLGYMARLLPRNISRVPFIYLGETPSGTSRVFKPVRDSSHHSSSIENKQVDHLNLF